MAEVTVHVPELGDVHGSGPIVIVGPNGSGKTKLAQKLASDSRNSVSTIGAQRRTWVDDNLPVQEKSALDANKRSQIKNWHHHAWRPTEEINYVLSSITQEYIKLLSEKNDEEIKTGDRLGPITTANFNKLQRIWSKIYPLRHLHIGDFFPRVKRLDIAGEPTYTLREMSDGERSVLYMAARVLAAEESIIMVDEPELHLHSRLSVEFWNQAEILRSDCRFIYITHDLNFVLSRQNAVILAASSAGAVSVVEAKDLPQDAAADILGAATLPFYAKRIVFYEGRNGAGFADEFMQAWFSDVKTFAIPVGNCDAVKSTVSGLANIQVAGAEVVGLIDRDFLPDSMLNALPSSIKALDAHEIESVFCDDGVIAVLARQQVREPDEVICDFKSRVRGEFGASGNQLSNVIAKRVRARVGDLLNNAFTGEQIRSAVNETVDMHVDSLANAFSEQKLRDMFVEEEARITSALKDGGKEMLMLLPGKQLFGLLAKTLGLSGPKQLEGLIVRMLRGGSEGAGHGHDLVSALRKYLPARTAEEGAVADSLEASPPSILISKTSPSTPVGA